MPILLHELSVKLINKILFAASQQEVKNFISTDIKILEQQKRGKELIGQFVKKVISELESFNPLKQDAQQWSNIKMARIIFNRVKQQLDTASD